MSTLRHRTSRPYDEPEDVAPLREAMVRDLQGLGALDTDEVIAAFLTVPRHLFATDEPLETVYAANTPLVTKKNSDGQAISSVSAAHIQATMLEQAEIKPGMRVLEIGSGGYNAALLAELVGDSGQVTSVDIDPDIVARAQQCLAAAGYDEVNVVLADAEGGVAEHAPYDRVIVTVGAWDIPPVWIEQLSADGQIIVPFRFRGLTRSVAFERQDARLVSRDYRLCGFVPMQGAGEHTERPIRLDGDDVVLRTDENGPFDEELLRAALHGPKVELWSSVVFDQVDQLDLWLGTAIPVFGLLRATKAPIEKGLVGRSTLLPVPTSVREGSFAYRMKRPIEGTDEFETGVYAHGPDAEVLAEEYVELIRVWDREHRDGSRARIEVFPAGTPDGDLPRGRLVDKKHTRVVITWP
ncbi:methyltransferase, FxLD system [Umezawaea sp. Da 62-37]|uniref:methyltransferase, FxLD system n=1 Tax=Umezawaea sp. Da 62-37 TaxID=3075927 RepID=UPI0028F6CFD6|nr:methyltransferase, FxLD system [Umezawaea sp. Da 62-37]WNV90246.1 methyltransferase, FxLD system [Umezawaea sp. Da 62-37]